MKFTQEEFKKYINTEVKKLALAEGWITPETKTEDQPETTLNLETKNLKEEFETIAPVIPIQKTEKPKEVIQDVKNLNEELKRMKQLVDFRSPMLGQA